MNASLQPAPRGNLCLSLRTAVLTALALLAIAGKTRALGVSYTTIANGDWNSAIWTPSGIPAAGSTVTINKSVTVTDPEAAAAVNNGDGGNLTITGALTVTTFTAFENSALILGNGINFDPTSFFLSGASQIEVGFGTATISAPITDQSVSAPGSFLKSGAGTLILSGNNTYSGGTTIEGGTLEAASLGAGGIVMSGGELLTSADLTMTQAMTLTPGSNNTLAATSSTTATYTGAFSGSASITIGDSIHGGIVNLETPGGFNPIGFTTINVTSGAIAGLSGFIGKSTTISGANTATSILLGFVVPTSSGNTPLFIYNPANETGAGSVSKPASYTVSVSDISILAGSSTGGHGGSSGAGLGGGAFIGAGATLILNNVLITNDLAEGGLADGSSKSGGFGGNAGASNGGLFNNNGGGAGNGNGAFGSGGGTTGVAGFGGGGGMGGFGGGGFILGGVGGGSGSHGGSGAGLGGGIFVQNNGTVIISGNSTFLANSVFAGTTINGAASGAAAGSDIFMMGGSTVTLAPGAGNTVTIGVSADEAADRPSNVADDSAYSLPAGSSYTPGSGRGAALVIGNAASPGGLVILHGNNTYAEGTLIGNGATLQVFLDSNLGALDPRNLSVGMITFTSNGELLTDSTNLGGFVTSRFISMPASSTMATLAAVTGTTATYLGSWVGAGSLTIGDSANGGTVNLETASLGTVGGFNPIVPSIINVTGGVTAGLFGYLGKTTAISGDGSAASTLKGFSALTTANNSDTPLFIYNPSNETATGSVSKPTPFTVSVSNIRVSFGFSQGGIGLNGGAGLGGGAFVGAGATLILNNVVMTGNQAVGGNADPFGFSSPISGGFGGNGVDINGGLFVNEGGLGGNGNGAFGSGAGTKGNGGFGGGGGVGGFGGGGSISGGVGGGSSANGGSGAGLGGGIFVQNNGTVVISGNSTISGNSASPGSNTGGASSGAGAGADIFMMNGSTVTLAPGTGNRIHIGAGADDAAGQISEVADDSAYSLPGGGSYTPGSGAGAALVIGNASSPGGLVILHGNNTYAEGTLIGNGATLEAFQDSNLGALDTANLSVGMIMFTSNGELLTDSTTPGGFITSRFISMPASSTMATLAAVTGTTATYTGSWVGAGSLTIGDPANGGTVNLETASLGTTGGFNPIVPSIINVTGGATAGLFGYLGKATAISGAGSAASTLKGFTATTSGNGSDTPLFLYNPANETASGAASNPTAYTVSVSNLTVTNGLSKGGNAGATAGGGAGLGGGAFVGAGVTLNLNNVVIIGNSAVGGSGNVGSGNGGGGLGGDAFNGNAGGLFTDAATGSGNFGGGGETLGAGGFGGGGAGGLLGHGGAGGFGGGGGASRSGGIGGGSSVGGGAGLGGGIFVQNSGSVIISGNSTISGNVVETGVVTAGTTAGAAAGADIFIMNGGAAILAPGTGNTLTIGGSADDATGQVSDIADDSAYSLPGGSYTAGSGGGAALTIGNSFSPGGVVILHGNNTYAAGTLITNSATLEVFQDANLGAFDAGNPAVGAITFSGNGDELLTNSPTASGFFSSRSITLTVNATLAAVASTTATYAGAFNGAGSLTLGDSTHTGMVIIQGGSGFGPIGLPVTTIASGATAGLFGYIGQPATIKGVNSAFSTLKGFTLTTSGNGSDTPLFLYNPANETASGAIANPTAYTVSVSNLTVTNGLSKGGSSQSAGGAGLGGGAFVGAGATLILNNVAVTGNAAVGGSSSGANGTATGGGLGGDALSSSAGGLFTDAGAGPGVGGSFGGGGSGNGISSAIGGFGGGGGSGPLLIGGSGGFGGGGGVGGVGGGSSSNGAGGAGFGGGIFVQNGGSVIVSGNSVIAGNFIQPGLTATQRGGGPSGAAGAAAGADIFIMNGGAVTLAPGTGGTITIGAALDDAAGAVSDVADDSAYSLPGGSYTAGSGAGAALTIGGASSPGGLVILHGNNTYAAGTFITNGATLEVFQDANLGALDAGNPAVGAIIFSGNGGELLTNATATGGFITTRAVTIAGSDTLAAVTGTTATYTGAFTGAGFLTLGDAANSGTVNLELAGGFKPIGIPVISITSGVKAGLFGYIGQSTTIIGAGPAASTLKGFAVTTSGNGSDTPLFLYNPANETASGAVGNPIPYAVSVSNLTVTNGLSQGGFSQSAGGAGLGGGAFVGAGATLALNNVIVTGNTAIGGSSSGANGTATGGGLGGDALGTSAGGLFTDAGASPGNGGSFGGGGSGNNHFAQTGGFGGGGGSGVAFAGGVGGFGGGGGAGGVGGGSSPNGAGGAGFGGGIFVQNGGSVIVSGNSVIAGNSVQSGAAPSSGAAGAMAGADIFIMNGGGVTLAPGTGSTITIGATSDDAIGQVSDVADDSAYSLPGGSYTAGSGAGAALTIGSASSPGGAVLLHGNNTYAGGTLITNRATLEIFQGTNLGATDAVNSAVGAITLSGNGELLAFPTHAPLRGGLQLPNAISITGSGVLAATTSRAVTFGGAISGSGALVAGDSVNHGMVNLSNANTYSGGTVVAGGVLNATNSSGSATGSGAVTVASGALLGGSGAIIPSAITSGVAVDIAAGGILSPSDGSGLAVHLTVALAPGTSIKLDSGSKFIFDLGASTATSDEVMITGGALNLNGQNFGDFTFNAEGGFAPGTYTLFNSTGITGTLGANTNGTVDGYNAMLSLDNSNLELQVAVVPEPSTWTTLLSGLGLLVLIQRRRRTPHR